MSPETGNTPTMHTFSTKVLSALSALLVFLAASAQAQEATAGLSSPSTSVGAPVEIVVTVRDARSAEVPESLSVEGLQIQLFGRSTRFEMHNFKITSSLTYTYSVVPLQPGEFDIPPFEVRVGNKTLKTNPLRLSVADAGRMQAPPALPQLPSQQLPSTRSGSPQSGALPYFGELLLSKKKAYVGEVIPSELRYYFNTSIGGEVGDRPSFTGEGFTVQNFAHVPKREQIVNGENYIVFAFQTAITPAKSGALQIPSATLEARLQLPGGAPSGMDDFFRQFGGAMPPGMFTNAQNVAIETSPVTLEVVPLPKQGRPDDFSGAIGKFEMQATVNPKKAGPGDPVTLRIVISGQGNFEAMGPPILTGDEGWRTYPPTEKFESSDAINFSGKKSYEFLLIARSDQAQTPSVGFGYFDPDTGKYELLTQPPLAVEARAGESPAALSADATSNKAAPTPVPAITPAVVSPAQAGGAGSWTPLLLSPAFLLANAALALAWMIGFTAFLLHRGSTSPAGIRRKRRRHLKASLAALETCSDNEFTARAVECLLTALDTESHPLAATSRIEALVADGELKHTLHDLLSRDAESKYSAGGVQSLGRDTRTRILEALKKIAA